MRSLSEVPLAVAQLFPQSHLRNLELLPTAPSRVRKCLDPNILQIYLVKRTWTRPHSWQFDRAYSPRSHQAPKAQIFPD